MFKYKIFLRTNRHNIQFYTSKITKSFSNTILKLYFSVVAHFIPTYMDW